ncbi:MAG: DUF3987 domain-containing protein [Hyphomicrobiales bacterium]|nr:DUF3987 domain-containing protein [Hyphomicrobiales bacterium]
MNDVTDDMAAPADNLIPFASNGRGDDTRQSAHDWPEPQPLPAGLPPVPAFNPELLPQRFRVWALDIAERMQCPVDYPAVGLVVSAGAIIGRQVAIRPKRRDDWQVVPNLWGAIVGRPGVLKTPALDEAMRPLRLMEARAAELHREILGDWQAGKFVAKEATQVAKTNVRKALKDGDIDRAKALAREELEADNDGPKRSRYIVNDTTVEALGEILNENPRGVLAFRDELMGFLRSLDRDGYESARAFYLEAWNGTGRFTYDRIARGTTDIEAACVSILGGIQPGPLSGYLDAAVRHGAADDGLMQRFQLVVWPDVPTHWRNVDRYPNHEAKNEVVGAFKYLDALDATDVGAEQDEGELPHLRFADGAQGVFDDFRSSLEHRLRQPSEHPAFEAHLSKYRSLVPSLALICHLVDELRGPVSEVAVCRAIEWADFLEAHARRLYRSVTHADFESATALAERLLRNDLQTPFTLRQVYQHGWTRLASRDRAQAAVAVLEDLDWLASETLKTGGRPKQMFKANPAIWRSQ